MFRPYHSLADYASAALISASTTAGCLTCRLASDNGYYNQLDTVLVVDTGWVDTGSCAFASVKRVAFLVWLGAALDSRPCGLGWQRVVSLSTLASSVASFQASAQVESAAAALPPLPDGAFLACAHPEARLTQFARR